MAVRVADQRRYMKRDAIQDINVGLWMIYIEGNGK